MSKFNQTSGTNHHTSEIVEGTDTQALIELLRSELQSQTGLESPRAMAVVNRIVQEVERICRKSDRIQTSGEIRSWQLTLARHRLQTCLAYYKLGSKQGRVELHSNLSVMIYRHVAASQSQLSFSARYNLIEDFLQDFYAESLKAFRRENDVDEDYTPRTQLELAEYMAFTEQYAKRRIQVPNRLSQQLIVLRAQRFVKRQRLDVQTINVEAVELGIELDKDEEAKEPSRLSAMQQAREHLVAQDIDPSEAVLRDRVISELLHYLESQGHSDCADYLVLKLQNLAASDIDEILGLTPRERDYLQKRFKYHVEKFSRSSHWKLVHQWLGADLDQKLGMSSKLWESFVGQLNEQQQQLLSLKQAQKSEQEIAKALGWTPKQVQKRWTALLEVAWKTRNSVGSEEEDITAPALRRTNDTSERNLVSEGSNGKPLKFYLPLELDRQLKFKATANSEPTSAIVERALVSFLNKTDESEKSDGQTHQISTYQDYEKLIEINPNDYKAWYGCGVVLKNLGSYEEAIASLDKALEIKPDSHKAWYARGNALYGLDFYEEAIASYNKAIELKPDYAEAWHYRGKALDELGRHEEASANYKRILKIKSDYNTISNKREKAPGDLGGYEGQHPVLRVLVVDEHELTRFSLKLALSSQSQIDLVGLASNGKEAIEMIERYRPDVIILDLQMPVMDGLSASTHIKSISPTTQIIAYASVEDPQIEVMAQTAPIDVFCKKDTATKDLINLVKQLGKRKVTQQEHSA